MNRTQEIVADFINDEDAKLYDLDNTRLQEIIVSMAMAIKDLDLELENA